MRIANAGRTTVLAVLSLLLFGSASLAMAQQAKTHLGGKASGLVTLFANVPPGTAAPLQEVDDTGNVTGNFVLPQGRVLIVTDLLASVNGIPIPGITRGGLINQAHTGASSPYFSFDATQQGGTTIHLTGGARWREVPEAINAADSSNAVFLNVYGYLAKDK